MHLGRGTGGIILGEARYRVWQATAMIKRPVLRTTVRAVVDPFGEIERAFGEVC